MSERMTITTLEVKETLIERQEDCCKDCPDVNSEPPSKSDCPYFEIRSSIPVCNREDGMQKMLESVIRSAILE